MNTETLAGCIPGCKQLRPLGDDRYAADVTVGVAVDHGLLVEATGRPGFVKGSAQVSLAAADTGTTVTVTVTAGAGGMIARVGQRLLESVARMTMDRFFACLSDRVGGP